MPNTKSAIKDRRVKNKLELTESEETNIKCYKANGSFN